MKIKEFSMLGYRCISALNFVPGHVNVFVGKTGSGKTTAVEAVGKVFSGVVAADDIQAGAKRASISVTLEDENGNEVVLERRRTGSGVKSYIDGMPNSMKAANAHAEKMLGVPLGAIESMSGVKFFSGKSGKEIGKLIYSLLPLHLTIDKVVEIAGDLLGFLSAGEEQALRDTFKDTPKIGDKELSAAYKVLFAERTGVNGAIKKLKALVEKPIDAPVETKEVLQKRLEEIASAEEKVRSHAALMNAYSVQCATRNRIIQQVGALDAELASMANVAEPDATAEAKLITERDQCRNMLISAQQAVAQCSAVISNDKEQISRLSTGVCPLNSGLYCTTDKSRIIQDLNAHAATAEERMAGWKKRAEQLQGHIAKRDAALADISAQKAMWSKKAALLQQRSAFVIPEEPQAPLPLSGQTDFSVEKASIYQKLANISAEEERQKAEKELKALEERAVILERLLSVLNEKGGIRGVVLESTLTPFEKRCAEKAETFRPGFGVKFDWTDGLDILIETHKGSGYRSISTASTGEFLFVSYMLMSVIAQVRNPGFMLLDGLDALDAETLSNFLEIVVKDTAIDYVFATAINHTDTVAALQRIGANIVEL